MRSDSVSTAGHFVITRSVGTGSSGHVDLFHRRPGHRLDLCDRTWSRWRWTGVTTAIAGVGWAAASAPSVLATQDSAPPQPPLVLALLAAASLGCVMGLLLGSGQATLLRGRVRLVPVLDGPARQRRGTGHDDAGAPPR